MVVGTAAAESRDVVAEAMKFNRAGAADFGIDVSTDLPLTIHFVEDSLLNPLDASDKILKKINELKDAGQSADISAWCGSFLSASTQQARSDSFPTATVEFNKTVPENLRIEIEKIYSSIKYAQVLVAKSVNSIKPQQKEWIKQIVLEQLDAAHKPAVDYSVMKKNGEEISYTQWKAEVYRSVKDYDVESACRAEVIIASACDSALPVIQKIGDTAAAGAKIKSSDGKVLVSGTGDDVYTSEDIKDVDLLIDLGGNNSYLCNIGAAGENEVKVVIDLGENIKVETSSAAAGSGLFGVAVMYLPAAGGTKTITTGSFSQGSGIFGAGALFISGKAEMRCGYFGQGSGAFGAGVLAHRAADASVYSGKYFNQGTAYTKGVGLFYLKGSSISVEGGFDVADSRESQGYTSLCQGVGFGPRALAGGGLGIAVIDADNSEFNSSYFAHGAGYWHSAGIFCLTGSGNKVQSRRYCQGAGVHSAFGAMFVNGDKNQTIAWGVGPAYGWDRSIGIFNCDGNDNIFQAEWGSGQGSGGSRSIFTAGGDNPKVWLPGLGSGSFARDTAGYGTAIISGKNILLKDEVNRYFINGVSKFDPWGVLLAQDVHTSTYTALPEVKWPNPERKTPKNESREEMVTSQFRVYDIYLRRWDIESLLAVPPENAALLIKLYQPFSVEEQLALRTILSSYGKSIYPALKKEFDSVNNMRKPLILNLMSFMPAENAAPEALKALKDANWRMRATAVRTLSYLFNSDTGYEPGRYTALKEMIKLLEENKNQSAEEKARWPKLFVNKSIAEMFGHLSLPGDIGTVKKTEFYKIFPNLFDNVNEEFKGHFRDYIISKRDVYLEAFRNEVKFMDKNLPKVETGIKELLNDSDVRVRAQAITALGEIHAAGSAELIIKYLHDDNTAVREAAAYSIARFGAEAAKLLKKEFKGADDITKSLIVTSVSNARDNEMLKILDLGFDDKSKFVQLTSVSTALNLRYELDKQKKKYIKKIEKITTKP